MCVVEDAASESAAEIAQLQNQLKELQSQQVSVAGSAQMAEIQATLNKLVSNQNSGKGRQYGCASCKADGVGRTCKHCFACGKDDHKVQDCPKKRKESEEDKNKSNSNRSPTRD